MKSMAQENFYVSEFDAFDDDVMADLEDCDSIAEEFLDKDKKSMDFDAVAIMKDYNSGDPVLKEEATYKMYCQLENYIKYILYRNYPSYAKNKQIAEDMFNNAIIGILEYLPKYDATISAPTTFFYRPIIHKLQEHLDKMVYHTTTHYSTNLNKIKKIINRYANLNKTPTIQDLINETGLREETIKKCLSVNDYQNEIHYENEDFLDSQRSDTYSSPEDIYLENERNTILYESLESLTEDEKVVICLKYGLTGQRPMSYKDIADLQGFKVEYVKRCVRRAQSKLQNDKRLNSIYKSNLVCQRHLNENLIPLNNVEEATITLQQVAKMPEGKFLGTLEFTYN